MKTGPYALSSPSVAARRRRVRWREQVPAWLFLLPALLVFACFTWYPMLIAIGYSFQHVNLLGETSWAGLDNYRRMVADPLFYTAWKNVADFTLLSLGLGFLFPVAVALLVNEMRRLAGFFQLLYYVLGRVYLVLEPANLEQRTKNQEQRHVSKAGRSSLQSERGRLRGLPPQTPFSHNANSKVCLKHAQRDGT